MCHVNVNNKAHCDICQSWVHHVDYKYLQGPNDPWYSLSSCSKIFPFGTLTSKDFISFP